MKISREFIAKINSFISQILNSEIAPEFILSQLPRYQLFQGPSPAFRGAPLPTYLFSDEPRRTKAQSEPSQSLYLRIVFPLAEGPESLRVQTPEKWGKNTKIHYGENCPSKNEEKLLRFFSCCRKRGEAKGMLPQKGGGKRG